MAFRMSRVHLVLPTGTKFIPGRWPVAGNTLGQSTKLSNLGTTASVANQYRRFSQSVSTNSQLAPSYTCQHHHTSFNTVNPRPTNSICVYLPQFNYAGMRQRVFPMLHAYRNYSEGVPESPRYTDSKSSAAAGQGSGDAAISDKAQSSTQKIKILLREYGTVAVVFHISMSLCTLSVCYLLVSNGLDVDKVLEYFNFESSTTKKGASTFAISYLLYKMLLPVRATVTIACVPIIVRSLRARGWMKGVAKAPSK